MPCRPGRTSDRTNDGASHMGVVGPYGAVIRRPESRQPLERNFDSFSQAYLKWWVAKNLSPYLLVSVRRIKLEDPGLS